MSKLILEIDFKGVVCLKYVTVFICTVMMMCFCCMNVSADDLSEISAKSAIVIDGETGDVLFEKNAMKGVRWQALPKRNVCASCA